MLITLLELAVCVCLFMFAKWRMNNSKPTMQWYDPSDATIRKPFAVPTFSMERITYGSLFIPYLPMLGLYLYDPQGFDLRVPVRFLFGWALSGFICYIVKGWVGRLRPNFMVTNGDTSIEGHQIFTSIIARNPSYKQLFEYESRKSFYSGHSTVGAFSGAFIGILLHATFPQANILLSLLKVLAVLIGLYPGITQGICYFHHWSDVITGHLAGIFFAFFSFYLVK